MKKYVDRQECLLKNEKQTLKIAIKDKLLKSLVYEKALKEKTI